MSGIRERLTKPILLRNAATAMAQWLVDQRMSASELERRLNAGEDVLAMALQGVNKSAVTAARAMAGSTLSHLVEPDFKQILALLWEIPDLRDHALLLGRPDIYQHYYLPAMERVKAWLATGSPS